MSFIIGIDPGLSGGVATYYAPWDQWTAVPMPVAGGEVDAGVLSDMLKACTDAGVCVAVVEKVHSMPKQGVSATFKFGCGYGMVRGVLAAHRIPTHLVTPQAWKARVLAGTTKDKDAAIDYCRRVHPSVQLIQPRCRVPHDGVADALCLAEYGRLAL